MPGSTIAVIWASDIARRCGMFSTWSPLVIGDTWGSQLRRRSSEKSQVLFSLRHVHMNSSRAIHLFLSTIVGE